MIEPYLAETLAAVQIAMEGAKLRVADLDESCWWAALPAPP